VKENNNPEVFKEFQKVTPASIPELFNHDKRKREDRRREQEEILKSLGLSKSPP